MADVGLVAGAPMALRVGGGRRAWRRSPCSTKPRPGAGTARISTPSGRHASQQGWCVFAPRQQGRIGRDAVAPPPLDLCIRPRAWSRPRDPYRDAPLVGEPSPPRNRSAPLGYHALAATATARGRHRGRGEARSWSAPTASEARRRTTSPCNCASAASARLSSAGCWRTCVSKLTCAICSSRVSRSSSQRTRRLPPDTQSGVTAIRRRSSTSGFLHTEFRRLTKS